ncbi:PB1 domain-containing protein [Heracleum sosnowskyi]|uniref:PB1 domain-containing protein n=1 Tax=Heracleum sosnowskyi TaxID=360622 RepID=A0AAD8M0Z9_9APIA|nr:PB1 domain-containing protein [Heracleum sosnowskyi]
MDFEFESENEEEDEDEPPNKDDENDHAKLESDESPETFLFKIKYERTLKRLNLPIYDGNLHFDMDELRGRITYIFGLPRYSKLEISYIDEDGELITMTDENDLVDIMTQKKLQYRLRMYVKLINNAITKQGVQAGLEPIRTPVTFESGSSYDSLDDDFLIYECL